MTLILGVAALGVFAPSAGAVLVQMSNGRVAGVTPIAGMNPASIPGSRARRGQFSPLSTADNGNLSYQGGSVLHGSAPYLIFWDPANRISSADKALYERYFADLAAASGQASNVFSVDRQYTDTTGFADYNVSYAPSHAITDAQAYPTSGNCTAAPQYAETTCLFDSQIEAEVNRLIVAGGLPTGITGNAPIYFVVTPPQVNSCESDNSSCADNTFCAYHSAYASGPNTVLYANIPTVLAAHSPKSCQNDTGFNSTVESPNADPVPDVAIKYISHEFNETITDPIPGGGWVDSASGNEDGDNCNYYASPSNPAAGSSANAFLPTLGGSSSAGTLYDQLINTHQYYTQSEWSNGDVNCQMQPTTNALGAAFSAPTTAAPSTAVSFDPGSSSNPSGYTSTSWSFGDGSTSFSRVAPAVLSHTFSAAGTYTVKLTLVDQYGNLSAVSHTITVATGPTAAFTFSPAHPLPNGSVAFDGSGSSDAGGTITSYGWDFGDGSGPGSGATPSHAYTSAGTYTVTLTVGDGTSTGTQTHTVTVDSPPSAAFSFSPAHPLPNGLVAFDGSGSGETNGSIVSYSWNFGDGSAAGTGAAPSHAFTAAGAYTVVLTVTDQDGHTTTATHTVTVDSAPSALFSFSPAHPLPNGSVAFDGSGSGETNGSIVSYSWNFGDGSAAGTGAAPSHAFTAAGAYTVVLTITDQDAHTTTATHTVTVDSPPSAAFSVTTTSPASGSPVAFDGSASSETNGTIASYSWNFGDGSAAGTGATPSHAYAAGGTYTVFLTVTDQDGHTATTSHSVPVASGPTASFTLSPAHPLPNGSVAFDGSASSQTGGSIVSYSWDFGDGSPAGTGAKPSHAFSAPGAYAVVLTVTDLNVHTATTSHTVTVDSPPAAAFGVTTVSPIAGSSVAFDGSASSETNGTIASYSWNFGDGSAAGAGVNPSHAYSAAGSYTVALTVTDQDGHTATTSHSVTVAAKPQPNRGSPSAVILVGTSHPVAGGSVSFSAAGSSDRGSTIVSYHWSFGDGATSVGRTSAHTYAKPGRYPVSLTVTDATGVSSTAAATETVRSASVTGGVARFGHGVASIKLALSGPGKLTVATRRFKVKRAGALNLKVKLSPSEIKRIQAHHPVTIRLKLKFSPRVGKASSETLVLKLKA